MHYNRYRYYDPDSGRLVSKNPIGLAGGINVYQHGPNSTAWIDPLALVGNRANRRAGRILQDIDAKGGGCGSDRRFVQVPAKTRHATLLYQNDYLGTLQPFHLRAVTLRRQARQACDTASTGR
nr:RHS repeat-associated core domain-containing protein [Burkholderia lata]